MASDAIKVWHRAKLKIDLDTVYEQGIITVTLAGSLVRVAWKCDDATFKIGTPRDMWLGHESFGDPNRAQKCREDMTELYRSFGLEPKVVE